MAVIRPPMPTLGFTLVPNAWIRDPDLPQGPKALLVYYLSHAEGYRCSVAQAARELGVGRDTIGTQNKKLLALGYLVDVEQRRGDGGRWAENDYAISTCTDRIPPRPGGVGKSDTLSENPTLPGVEVSSETVPVITGPVGPGTVNPPLRRQRGEDQPIPPGSGGDGGRHLTPVPGQPATLNQRTKILTDEHYEACGKLENWNAVAALVRKALAADHDDAAVRAALAFLRDTGRTVTGATLRAALTGKGARAVGANGYRPPGGYAPYRNPDPTDPANAHAFEGPL